MTSEEILGTAIVALLCCWGMAYALFVIGYFGKDSHEPIAFWAGGEDDLKSVIKDIKSYNKEMGKIFISGGWICFLLGIFSMIHWLIGLVGIGLVSSLGVWFLWKRYQAILKKYS